MEIYLLIYLRQLKRKCMSFYPDNTKLQYLIVMQLEYSTVLYSFGDKRLFPSQACDAISSCIKIICA
jgi:hypothetical protein